MLDPGGVPDLDGNRNAQHDGENAGQVQPPDRSRRVDIEQLRRKKLVDALSQHLEKSRRRDEHDLPVEREATDQPPGGLVKLGDEERREAPDFFLWANLA